MDEMLNVTAEKRDEVQPRDISVITAEIKSIRQQANALALLCAVEIGRRLDEAKRALPYGEWGRWLSKEVEFSQSTANNFMRLYEEYGSAQISIFGASVDSQTIAKLPYSKAIQLLAIPKNEREAFAEEVGAEDLSVKELKAAIEEREKAQKIADEQKQLKEELARKLALAEQAAAEALKKADEAEKLKNEIAAMQDILREEREKAKQTAEKLEKAEKDPKIPKETLAKIRKEAEEAAKKAAGEESKKALEEAKKKAEKAEADAAKAKEEEKQARFRLEEANKKLKTASPEVAAFKALFDEVQATVARLHAMIDAMRQTDAETAEKLSGALKAFGARL